MMNKIFLLLLLVFFDLNAEEEKQKHDANNLVEWNFWSFVPIDKVTFYNLQYLRRIAPKNVFGIDLKLPVNSNIDGFGLGFEYRHYFFENALKGFYFNPGLTRIELKANNLEGSPEEVEIYSLNLLIGYSIIFGKHFTFDVGGGISYNTGPSLQDKELAPGQSNTLPNFRFALGWAF